MGKSSEVYTVAQVADILSVSKQQIYNMVRKDEIPYFRIGKLVRFRSNELQEWINELPSGKAKK